MSQFFDIYRNQYIASLQNMLDINMTRIRRYYYFYNAQILLPRSLFYQIYFQSNMSIKFSYGSMAALFAIIAVIVVEFQCLLVVTGLSHDSHLLKIMKIQGIVQL